MPQSEWKVPGELLAIPCAHVKLIYAQNYHHRSYTLGGRFYCAGIPSLAPNCGYYCLGRNCCVCSQHLLGRGMDRGAKDQYSRVRPELRDLAVLYAEQSL